MADAEVPEGEPEVWDGDAEVEDGAALELLEEDPDDSVAFSMPQVMDWQAC